MGSIQASRRDDYQVSKQASSMQQGNTQPDACSNGRCVVGCFPKEIKDWKIYQNSRQYANVKMSSVALWYDKTLPTCEDEFYVHLNCHKAIGFWIASLALPFRRHMRLFELPVGQNGDFAMAYNDDVVFKKLYCLKV
jgi:hypothetical protein